MSQAKKVDAEPEDKQLKWVDPRDKKERRQLTNHSLVPASGCRRKKERRNNTYTQQRDWWLQRDYSQTIQYMDKNIKIAINE